MTTLYIARHGETVFNVEGRLQGRSDSPLTEQGWRQADQLATRLASVAFAASYSSPSPRAVSTARRVLRSREVSLTLDERLYEMGMGAWEGRLFEELDQENPHAVRRFRETEETFRAPGGETWREVQARVAEAFRAIVERHPEGDVLLVSHGVSVRMLVAHLMSLQVPGARVAASAPLALADVPRMRNCSLTLVEASPTAAKLVLVGCDKHLEIL